MALSLYALSITPPPTKIKEKENQYELHLLVFFTVPNFVYIYGSYLGYISIGQGRNLPFYFQVETLGWSNFDFCCIHYSL